MLRSIVSCVPALLLRIILLWVQMGQTWYGMSELLKASLKVYLTMDDYYDCAALR